MSILFCKKKYTLFCFNNLNQQSIFCTKTLSSTPITPPKKGLTFLCSSPDFKKTKTQN